MLEEEASIINRNLYFLIVNYNSSDLVIRLLDSINIYDREKYQVVIINNSVEDQDIFALENDYVNIIQATENLGFGKACNLGLSWINEQDQAAIVWLINPDAYFYQDALNTEQSEVSRAIAFFTKNPQISILGTIVENAQGEITDAGGTFNPATGALSILTNLPGDTTTDYQKTDWVSACSLLINLSNFEQCPYFDPRYFLYYEDLDFCLRYAQQGHQIAVTNSIRVKHNTSSITDRNIKKKYQHITQSYLIHIEKYGTLPIFILTNIRMSLNTIRLIFFKPQQGIGKLIGIYNYWKTRLSNLI